MSLSSPPSVTLPWRNLRANLAYESEVHPCIELSTGGLLQSNWAVVVNSGRRWSEFFRIQPSLAKTNCPLVRVMHWYSWRAVARHLSGDLALSAYRSGPSVGCLGPRPPRWGEAADEGRIHISGRSADGHGHWCGRVASPSHTSHEYHEQHGYHASQSVSTIATTPKHTEKHTSTEVVVASTRGVPRGS